MCVLYGNKIDLPKNIKEIALMNVSYIKMYKKIGNQF